MDSIQTDVSDEALVTAVRANMCDFCRHMSRSNPAEHFENKQFTRWYTPLPHPWFNGVLSSNPHNDSDDRSDVKLFQNREPKRKQTGDPGVFDDK